MKLSSLFMLIKPGGNASSAGAKTSAKEESGTFVNILGGILKKTPIENKTVNTKNEEPQTEQTAVLGVKKSIVTNKVSSKIDSKSSDIAKYVEQAPNKSSDTTNIETAEPLLDTTKNTIKKKQGPETDPTASSSKPSKKETSAESELIEKVRSAKGALIGNVETAEEENITVSKKTSDEIPISQKSRSGKTSISASGGEGKQENSSKNKITATNNKVDSTRGTGKKGTTKDSEEEAPVEANESSTISKSIRNAAASILQLFKPQSEDSVGNSVSSEMEASLEISSPNIKIGKAVKATNSNHATDQIPTQFARVRTSHIENSSSKGIVNKAEQKLDRTADTKPESKNADTSSSLSSHTKVKSGTGINQPTENASNISKATDSKDANKATNEESRVIAKDNIGDKKGIPETHIHQTARKQTEKGTDKIASNSETSALGSRSKSTKQTASDIGNLTHNVSRTARSEQTEPKVSNLTARATNAQEQPIAQARAMTAESAEETPLMHPQSKSINSERDVAAKGTGTKPAEGRAYVSTVTRNEPRIRVSQTNAKADPLENAKLGVKQTIIPEGREQYSMKNDFKVSESTEGRTKYSPENPVENAPVENRYIRRQSAKIAEFIQSNSSQNQRAYPVNKPTAKSDTSFRESNRVVPETNTPKVSPIENAVSQPQAKTISTFKTAGVSQSDQIIRFAASDASEVRSTRLSPQTTPSKVSHTEHESKPTEVSNAGKLSESTNRKAAAPFKTVDSIQENPESVYKAAKHSDSKDQIRPEASVNSVRHEVSTRQTASNNPAYSKNVPLKSATESSVAEASISSPKMRSGEKNPSAPVTDKIVVDESTNINKSDDLANRKPSVENRTANHEKSNKAEIAQAKSELGANETSDYVQKKSHVKQPAYQSSPSMKSSVTDSAARESNLTAQRDSLNEVPKAAVHKSNGSIPTERGNILSEIWKQHLAPAGEKILRSLSLPGIIRSIRNWNSESVSPVPIRSKHDNPIAKQTTQETIVSAKAEKGSAAVKAGSTVEAVSSIPSKPVANKAETFKSDSPKASRERIQTTQTVNRGEHGPNNQPLSKAESLIISEKAKIAETSTKVERQVTASNTNQRGPIQAKEFNASVTTAEEVIPEPTEIKNSTHTKNQVQFTENRAESTTEVFAAIPRRNAQVRTIWGVKFGQKAELNANTEVTQKNSPVAENSLKVETVKAKMLNDVQSAVPVKERIAKRPPLNSRSSEHVEQPAVRIAEAHSQYLRGTHSGNSGKTIQSVPVKSQEEGRTAASASEVNRKPVAIKSTDESHQSLPQTELTERVVQKGPSGNIREVAVDADSQAREQRTYAKQRENSVPLKSEAATPRPTAKSSATIESRDSVSSSTVSRQPISSDNAQAATTRKKTETEAPTANATAIKDSKKIVAPSERSVELNSKSTGVDKSPSARPEGQSTASVTSSSKSAYAGNQQQSAQNETQQQTGQGFQTPVQDAQQAATVQHSEFTTYIPRLSADDIRELQTLVQKALESSRTAMQDAKEVRFEWRQKDMGNVRFLISTHKSDVQVTIQADRTEVAEAIEKSRAVVERMITDQGLRVERFEVQVRVSADPQSNSNGSTQQRQADTNMQDPEHQSGSYSRETNTETPKEQAPAPRSNRLQGDREWVA